LPGDAFVYLFLGLLRPYKGLEDLFEAFETLEWPGMSDQVLIGLVARLDWWKGQDYW